MCLNIDDSHKNTSHIKKTKDGKFLVGYKLLSLSTCGTCTEQVVRVSSSIQDENKWWEKPVAQSEEITSQNIRKYVTVPKNQSFQSSRTTTTLTQDEMTNREVHKGFHFYIYAPLDFRATMICVKFHIPIESFVASNQHEFVATTAIPVKILNPKPPKACKPKPRKPLKFTIMYAPYDALPKDMALIIGTKSIPATQADVDLAKQIVAQVCVDWDKTIHAQTATQTYPRNLRCFKIIKGQEQITPAMFNQFDQDNQLVIFRFGDDKNMATAYDIQNMTNEIQAAVTAKASRYIISHHAITISKFKPQITP